MKNIQASQLSTKPQAWSAIYAGLVGLFIGLSLLKFGNPIILDHLVTHPETAISATSPALSIAFDQNQPIQADWLEKLYTPQTFFHGLWGLGLLALFAFKNSAWKKQPPIWLWITILAWFGWQFIASTDTVNDTLTKNTLFQFAACLVCLFIGWHGLPQNRSIQTLWIGITAGLAFCLWRGFTQHYGGLEAMLKIPDLQTISPELYKRAIGGRVFSTLIYANAFAGAILLLLPSTLLVLFRLPPRIPGLIRGVLLGLIAYLGIACFMWTGSKAGWLIAIGLIAACLFRIEQLARIRNWLILGICILGLAGFFVRYSKYFEKGATSVVARFDYWRAAWQTAVANPVTGTGPGTFMIAYKKVKAPESEMARLTHNDYLEQASDSGFPAFFAYLAFVFGSLYYLYRNSNVITDPLRYTVLLSVTAIFIQSFLEFGLYVPAIAWPLFIFLGWLLGTPAQPEPSLNPLPPETLPAKKKPARISGRH